MKNKYLLFCFLFLLAGVAHAQLSRLVGETKARYDGTAFATIGDTTWYIYSGIKDTTHNGTLAADSSYTLAYLPGYTSGNQSYRYYQSFVGAYNTDTLVTQVYDSTSATWMNYQWEKGMWDASNNITQHIIAGWDPVGLAWVNTSKTDYTYAGMNNTLKIIQVWKTTTSAWVNREKDSFAYDASNNMIYHLAQHWDTTGFTWVNNAQYFNTYNASNELTVSLRQNWSMPTSAWNNNSLTTYDYNAIPMLCNTIVQHWDTSGAWNNFSMDSLTYTTGNDIARETAYRWDTSHVWLPQQMNGYSYDATHDMLTDTLRNWVPAGGGSFANRQLKLYTYNTYNQVLTYTTESWNNAMTAWFYKFTGGGGPDVQYRYYYEYVDTVDHTGIGNVAVNVGSINVSPNPVGAVLQVRINWIEAVPFSMSIYDAMGMRVRSWSEPPMKNYTGTINVNDLPAGNYILRANADSRVKTARFVIMK